MRPALEQSKALLEQYLSTVAPDLRHLITPFSVDEHDSPYLYHISKDPNITFFRPAISPRSLNDRAIPKVCVGPSLMGCFSGYVSAQNEFHNFREDKDFRGGYYIYGIPFEWALKPDKKILRDVDYTDERWAIAFEPGKVELPAVKRGKVFVHAIRLVGNGKYLLGDIELYLQVFEGDSLRISRKHVVEPGYYRILVEKTQCYWWWNNAKLVTVEPIDRQAYYSAKRLSASLLAHTEVPPSAQWVKGV